MLNWVSKYPHEVLAIGPASFSKVFGDYCQLNLDDLTLDHQNLVGRRMCGLKENPSAWPAISVIRFRGVNYVWDGRHRVITAWLIGLPSINCTVQELPDEVSSKKGKV